MTFYFDKILNYLILLVVFSHVCTKRSIEICIYFYLYCFILNFRKVDIIGSFKKQKPLRLSSTE